MKRHLLICGERGVGKSTLIRRLLEHSTREVGGFVTKRLPVADENGFFPIYLYPASQSEGERHNEAANLVGTCDSRSSIRHAEVFDGLGAQNGVCSPCCFQIIRDYFAVFDDGIHKKITLRKKLVTG